MAQKVLVEVVDDLDGGVATQTVPFSIDGVQYEIDLSEDNAAELRDVLARFVSRARRTGGRKMRLAAGQSGGRSRTTTAEERKFTQEVRQWAQDNGYAVSDRGRLPSEVQQAYEIAQQEAAKPAKKVAATRKRSPRKNAAAK
ncbi:Lsr2 family protein [Amycolatopsis sp. NPDC047767]|uniref:histone-like nucleoid-structuring protein Lsr2 n=1 Tax=Amycolatopsis sp. NPDC047767 TaxID=3156765 RepID=UPI003451BA24